MYGRMLGLRTFLIAAGFCAAVATAQAQDAASDAGTRISADAPEANPDSGMVMTGAFGRYPMTREASGTSWQPDASPHEGVTSVAGAWMVMTHATLNAVYDAQGGPRGDDKAFLAGMVMVMAQRQTGDGGTIGLRAMLSPDPIMGPSGYPLLLATGETADGVHHLVDRQHPHDLFMELSASYSRPVGADAGIYVYAGLPGEPALGPPAFMHRLSGMDSPEAPITHHWLDSTHITFGVVTAGVTSGPFKLEGSVFNGREPDEHRWDIEARPLKSWSGRLSWNPTSDLSFQVSGGHLVSPEELEPDVNEDRLSASANYTRTFGAHGVWSTTLAFGRKMEAPGPNLDGWLLESAVMPDDRWTIFGRAERVEENELVEDAPLYTVGKLSVGVIYDIRVAAHWKVGLGGLVSRYRIPDGLKPLYGAPASGMGFVRLKLS